MFCSVQKRNEKILWKEEKDTFKKERAKNNNFWILLELGTKYEYKFCINSPE